MSIVLVGVGTFIRVRLAESPAFARIKSEKTEARLPIAEVLKHHRKSVALSMGARLAENAFFYVYTTFILAYATERIGVTKQTVLAGVLLAAALDLSRSPASGTSPTASGAAPSTCSAPCSRRSSSSRSSFSSGRGALS